MKNLSNNERLIIEYLIKNQTISNNEVRNFTSLGEDGAKKLLRTMVKKELINPVGEKRGRYYILNKK